MTNLTKGLWSRKTNNSKVALWLPEIALGRISRGIINTLNTDPVSEGVVKFKLEDQRGRGKRGGDIWASFVDT